MKKLIWLLPVLMVALLSGCLKDDPNEGTIVLLGTESDVKPIFGSNGVIPDTLQNFILDTTAMHHQILKLPEGSMPPDIQGEFVFPRRLKAHNGYGIDLFDTVFIRFGGDCDSLGVYYPNGQHNMMVPCDIKGDVMEEGSVFRIKSQPKAYVMGNGKDFAAYFVIDDYNCDVLLDGVLRPYKMKRGYIFTGKVTADGVENAILACINISVEGDIPAGSAVPREDYIYIYQSSIPSGAAIRKKWYNQ